jgi:hypothetical protein
MFIYKFKPFFENFASSNLGFSAENSTAIRWQQTG